MDGNGGLRRKDTTKGPPLRILSLDGGGIRGYSSIIMIQELMYMTYVEIEGKPPRREQIPKPCDHFDLIVGTGTGGLIALMLGRLRLDIPQCMELWTRLTRKVFETDKTIGHIPYSNTLYKASMLEMAIKEAVSRHTVDEDEGNDGSIISPVSTKASGGGNIMRHRSNGSVLSLHQRTSSSQSPRPAYRMGPGDPDALLHDERENRTKIALTAMYRNTPRGGSPVLLRSYNSRAGVPAEYGVKIWEAGRATSAMRKAFKPIKVGESVFLDDGYGDYNPAPQALDEATVNEWPGREVGVVVSVGCGKRPKGSDHQTQSWHDGFMGEWADMKHKMVAKIEGCERTHQYMKTEHLMKRGVNVENYYRFDVEIGVGDFGMNEWDRLSEIATNTKRYMMREQLMVQQAAAKLSKVYRAKKRLERRGDDYGANSSPVAGSITSPLAVELPGDMPDMFASNALSPQTLISERLSYESGMDKIGPVSSHPSVVTPPRSSDERSRPSTRHASPPPLQPLRVGPPRPPPSIDDPDRLIVTAPTPEEYRKASSGDKILVTDEFPRDSYPLATQHQKRPHRIEPPPLPPKTPLPGNPHSALPGRPMVRPKASTGYLPPPYPVDDDEAPPVVNMARKPEFRGR